KRTHAEEQNRAAEDHDLETALRLSKEEEEKRNKAVEDSNAAALFDDQAQLSNNPFAPSTSPTPVSPASGTPANGSSSGPVFNLQGTFTNSSAPSYASTPSPVPTSSSTPSRIDGSAGSAGSGPSRGPTWADQEHAHLASLFANRDDGLDTFGNVGVLRYGQTQAGRVASQKTGIGANNPFAHVQQQPQSSNEQPFFSI
ncbi:hypothetical protein ID866_1898, partial [Astraeus odoratus]